MHKYIDEYPPASKDRKQDAKRIFPYLSMSPEKQAKLYGDGQMCFSFDNYIYENKILNEWIHSLGDILFSESL